MNESLSPREKKVFLIVAVIFALLLVAAVVAKSLQKDSSPAEVAPEQTQWSKVSDLPPGNDAGIFEGKFKLSDGREVTCVVLEANKKGGLSCDWDSARGK